MNYLLSLGKTLDQPLLVSKFSKAVPLILTAGMLGYGLYDTYKAPDGKKNKTFIKNMCILGATAVSALISARGLKINGKKIISGLIDIKTPEQITAGNKRFLARFEKMLKESNNVDRGTKELFKNTEIKKFFEKMTQKPLSRKELSTLHDLVGGNNWGSKLLEKLLPDPENITSGKIFGEIKRLSVLGFIPVLGGIAGGVTGDVLTEKNWKNEFPNKVKEGFYQYFANIFLCNVGAGLALGAMEKMNIKSKAGRAAGMFAGILAVGVFGGSAIANYIGKKIINPLFDKPKNKLNQSDDLFSERKPEALDIGLHVDDLATVAVMSGLRWIEPALPVLYSISGYRAGIGYRNGEHCRQNRHGGCGKIKNFSYASDVQFAQAHPFTKAVPVLHLSEVECGKVSFL